MTRSPVARISGLLIGILAIIQVAQAAEVFPRSERNVRPFSLTDPEALVQAVTDEVEVFVRFDLPSVAEYNAVAMQAGGKMPAGAAQKSHAAKVSAQHANMRNTLASLGATELSALRVGANGMRVKINPRQLADLKQMPNVLSVAPVIQHYPDNAQSVPWIGTQAFWDAVGTGEGISIGVIDTGVDYTHANFGGPGTPADYFSNDPDIIEAGTFPTAKVVGGFDFAGTNYDASNPAMNTPVPDDDPLDENGHGSHVSGSAAGLGVPDEIGPGVAKGADLYGLKVFGAGGSTNLTSDAIEWALDPNGDGDMSDHLDVINMSLGSAFGEPNDPSAIASSNAADLGIIVVASAGNSGDVPYVTGAPAVSPATISVAATTKGGEVPAIEVSGDVNGLIEAIEGTSPFRIADGAVSGPLVQPDTATNVDGCGAIGVDMTDSIALISRGACAFALKSANAEARGAIGMVVYNDGTAPDRIAPIVMGGLAGATIPSVMIPSIDGQALSAAIDGGDSVNALMQGGLVADTAFGDLIAGFSSRGPGHGGSTFKPDVSGPGVNIISTAIASGDQGVSFQGTSMAAPHVAGVGALMRQLHPDLDTAGIKALIQNSANSLNDTFPAGGADLPLARQGVGRVDVAAAMNLGSYASPGGVSFGRLNPTQFKKLQQKVTVTNLSNQGRHFAVTHVPNQTLAGVAVICPNYVNVPRNGHKPFHIKIEMDPALSPFDFSSFSQTEVDGWCVLSDGQDELKVGYMATVDPASRMQAHKTKGGVTVSNQNGVAAGFAEGFTLTGENGLFLDGTNNAIAAVGFRTGDPAAFFGLPVIEMAVTSEAIWEAPSNLTWEFFIDVDGDGIDDVLLLGIDFSAVSSTGTIGDMVTAQFNLQGPGAFLDWFINIMDYNDRAAAMPFTTIGGGGFVPDSFDYTLIVTGRDGSIDVQVGSVDTAAEIVPDLNSFGIFGGTSVDIATSGPRGDMLWLFQNNEAKKQVDVVKNVK